jgi:Ca2+/Na+ antiporter
VTLLHFPLLLFMAYGADRDWNFSGKVTPGGPDLERSTSVLGSMDNHYLAFRRDAVRFISAGRRVMWKGNNGQTRVVNQPAENKKRAKKAKGPKEITSDPYVQLKIGSTTHKTKWMKKNLNPVWESDNKFTFASATGSDELVVEVWDHDDVSRDDFMGRARLSLMQVSASGLDTWVTLGSESGVMGGLGEVHIKVTTSTNAKGTNSVEVEVIEAKSLVGLDQESEMVDALASRLGSANRAMKEKYQNQAEIWQNMKVDWFYQFKDAIIPAGDKDENGVDMEPSGGDLAMHMLTVFWKVAFAFVPPANYYGGWLAFGVAISFIGLVTAVVGEIAALFGCVVGLKKAVTAITFVALGTSLPDTFASKAAAEGEKHADAAIGNVTGSNSVNVFLGIGLPWTLAALYAVGTGDKFYARSCGFGLSVFLYVLFAFVTLSTLIGRRFLLGGELGGNVTISRVCAAMLLGFWFIYVIVSSMRYYGKIEDIWTISGSLAPVDGSVPNVYQGKDMCAG